MLDQSFSAENFRNIFHIENRKGNLKKDMLPPKYIDIIKDIKLLKIGIKEKSKERNENKITKEEYLQFREENNNKIKEYQKKKDEVLYEQVKKISTNVNDNFKFTIDVDKRDEKPVYQLGNNLEAFYAIKQLQYNVRKTFKVKQADRYQILKQIKLLLSDNFPKYVIRTDIKSFYESIPQSEVLRKIEENTLLNYQSKKFIADILNEYENKKDTKEFEPGEGVPRGVGISAYLSELYMRDVDSKIKSLEHVTFYARYVDDIFIIFTPNNKSGRTNYFEQVNEIVKKSSLELKPETDDKTQLVNMLHKTEGFKEHINYLGYKFTIAGVRIKADENPIDYQLLVNLSENKIDKYKKRIQLSFAAYNEESKYNEKEARKRLFDCLRMLTGNMTLMNSKKGVKVGVYFSNSLLDTNNLKDLAELQGYLKRIIHTELEPYSKLNIKGDRLEKFKKQIETEFSFCEGFKEKRFHKFKIKELQDLKRIWKYETE